MKTKNKKKLKIDRKKLKEQLNLTKIKLQKKRDEIFAKVRPIRQKAFFSRTLLLVLGLLINVALIVLLLVFLKGTVSYWIFVVLSLLEIIFILNREGSSVLKISWIVILAVLPVFGGLFYLFVQIQQNIYRKRRNIPAQQALAQSHLQGSEIEKDSVAGYLTSACGFPAYTGTDVKFYPLGDDFLPAMTEELKSAEKYIFMEFFIISPGKVWDEILKVLVERSLTGVKVYLMFDGMNTISSLPKNYSKTLTENGINCRVFAPVVPFITTEQNNRDHRKICVIDGKVAYTGGCNLADEYANLIVRFGHWKDSAARFEGLAVQGLASLFIQMWNADAAQDGGEQLDYALLESMNTPVNAPGWMIPYGDSPLDKDRVGENVYIGFLNSAKKYVHIYTPYLVLGDQMLQALEYTARRGVDVKLILPHVPDKPYAFYLAHSYYKELLRSGVRIYEYTPGFVHAKEFISDDTIATIGTINLDFRSLYQHFENGVYMRDVPAIGLMEKDFQETLEKCEEFTMKDLEEYPKWKMAFGKAVRIFAPMF